MVSEDNLTKVICGNCTLTSYAIPADNAGMYSRLLCGECKSDNIKPHQAEGQKPKPKLPKVQGGMYAL